MSAYATTCWLAKMPGARGPCDGRLRRCHLIPQRLLKTMFPNGAVLADDGTWVPLGRREDRAGRRPEGLLAMLEDPALWVPGCGGPTGAGGHHGQLDQARTIRIPYEALPAATVTWAQEHNLEHWLRQEYDGSRAAA